MKDFQARGLFGARGIERKIFDIYYPKYNPAEKLHTRLAALGKDAHEKAKSWLAGYSGPVVAGLALGKMRLQLKKHLQHELIAIDVLVKKLL